MVCTWKWLKVDVYICLLGYPSEGDSLDALESLFGSMCLLDMLWNFPECCWKIWYELGMFICWCFCFCLSLKVQRLAEECFDWCLPFILKKDWRDSESHWAISLPPLIGISMMAWMTTNHVACFDPRTWVERGWFCLRRVSSRPSYSMPPAKQDMPSRADEPPNYRWLMVVVGYDSLNMGMWVKNHPWKISGRLGYTDFRLTTAHRYTKRHWLLRRVFQLDLGCVQGLFGVSSWIV